MNKILLVDDDRELTSLLKELLEMEGFNVIVAHDGEQALDLLDDSIDLLLLDVMMPKKNGIDTLKALRQTHQTPVIMLTARGSELDRVLGLELGGCQQPLGFQSIQINEIGVARKGRAALVGAVPIARGAQGQDLPDLLACRRKEIHKFFCLFAKAADPVGAGQAGHRHQNTTFTHCKSFLVSNFLLGLVCFLS